MAPVELRNLGHLTSLRHLDLSLSLHHAPPTLHHLSCLVNLRHCCLDVSSHVPLHIVDVALLFSALQLTSLHLLRVSRKGARPALPADFTSAMAKLGNLTHLCSLRLSRTFTFDDISFAAVTRLTHLTELWCGGMALSHPASPGHLPRLQRLMIGPSFGLGTSPAQLLTDLRPLLPLPSLIDLNGNENMHLHIAKRAPGTAAVPRSALRQLVGHLMAAPHLQDPAHVWLSHAAAHHGHPLCLHVLQPPPDPAAAVSAPARIVACGFRLPTA